jgi:hypothetical protein
MNKYKDEITNICGAVVTAGGSLLASGIELNSTFSMAVKIVMAVAVGIIGYFTGKKN